MMVFCDEKLARISRKQSLRKNKPVYTFVCAIAVYINYSLKYVRLLLAMEEHLRVSTETHLSCSKSMLIGFSMLQERV